ncbi:GntR family transcriptional regulator [Effusibacillus lacus]|uniref:HTH gntR-type domain-containing protein n=1 Tax=Effusibacillus lacus TaxID=1348429 RepID=A0A292YKA6_9BACL|nr:GntR family transcriptional regulator [Effusibacillus lacus]TCS68598.1 GntR family transcriptional regulator [Effusibacillus lacus]GAX88814.1 hypothetical protein EFBL_0428 [Effusibacillus lacus]
MELNEFQPLYKQLVLFIRKQIDEGVWPPGSQIPSEREMCEMFNVSRVTVRQAISEAEKDGLLERMHGKGTFVTNLKINQALQQITTFKETMSMRGLNPSTRVLDEYIEPSDLKTASVLNLTDGEPVFHLKLLGFGDELPMSLYFSTFPLDLGKKMAEAARNLEGKGEGFSTYDLYEATGYVKPYMVKQTFEVDVADEYIVEHLKIKQGSPIFIVTSIFYLEGGHPTEFRKAYYRGDKYKFYINRLL